MAWTLVHTFTSLAGNTYYLQVDWDAGTVKADISPAVTPEVSMTEAELGLPINSTIAYICVDTLKKYAYIFDAYPFIVYSEELSSAACGFTTPVCGFTWTASSANATNGTNTGSITVNPNEPGTYQYSLDGSIWQTSPVFNFLFPGEYIVYIRNDVGCTYTHLKIVGNTVVTVPTVAPTLPFDRTNRMCFFFRLIIDGVTHSISEPIKWDDVNIVGERDPEFHGYVFRYSDGNINLGFDCAAGRDLIETVYNANGQDGEIKFQYGYTFEAVDYILFAGKLMLNTYKWYAEKVECAIETEDLDTVFTSRLETKVDMTQVKTFDGVDIVPPTPFNLELHAKEILTKIESNTSNKIFESNSYTSHTNHVSILPDNTEAAISEIDENFQYPLTSQFDSPFDLDEYIVKPKTDGTATIQINLDMDIYIKRQSLFTNDRTFTAQLHYIKYKWNVGTQAYDTIVTNITTSGDTHTFPNSVTPDMTFNIKGAITETDTFTKEDKIFCYVFLFFNTNDYGYKFKLTQNNFTFNMQYLEASLATPANVWFLEDVVRQCIKVISNNSYAFKSSFFERMNANQLTDGCGSRYVVTNGFQIRQFEIGTRPLKVDLKKVLQSLNSIFCIGYNYINDSSGAYVRIERRDYFYQDREIVAISDLQSYREEVAIDIIYNELEMGYDKFQDSGFNSLDEFNTKSSWLTPIRKNKKKLSQLSSMIASGYSIESIRREQFRDKPSSSVTNDEESFIVAVRRVDATNWSTEKNEPFETVTGLISPATSYNLRISPKRALYNWFIWLKGIFTYKTDTDKITNTEIIQNTGLITRFNSDELCRVGDVDRATIEEKEDVVMTKMESTPDIYRPERVFIRCRLSPSEIQIINLAMTNRYGEEKDRGYIMIKKPTGEWQAIWLEKLSYNYWTESADISGLKKFESPIEPDESDCCRWLIVNGCYIKVNSEKLIA